MKITTYLILLVLLLATFPAHLVADVPPLPEDVLKSRAQLIITGTVDSIKGWDTKYKNDAGEFVRTNYLIDVTIQSVEKGHPSAPHLPVGARGFRIKEAPNGWAGPSGHYCLSPDGQLQLRLFDLKVGSKVRMYLGPQQSDGTREIVSPNGFQILSNP